MEEINAYIYGKKIGTIIEHQGVIYFEYDKKFKLNGLEISPIKLHTSKTNDAYLWRIRLNEKNGLLNNYFLL